MLTKVSANDLYKIVYVEDNLVLFDVSLNDRIIGQSIDSYIDGERLMLAVEPLFDSLNIRYQREENKLTVWKESDVIVVNLLALSNDVSSGWTEDPFYLYIDSQLFIDLFDVSITHSVQTLKLNIESNSFQFPRQKLAALAKQRKLAQSQSKTKSIQDKYDNLIPDQYQLYTMPHGSISLAASKKNDSDTEWSYSTNTVSDLLYHSTNITLSDSANTESTGRINFTRYKLLPDEYIFGAFDYYTFGDVSNLSDNLITPTTSGLGFRLNRSPEEYRNRNVGITIQESANPGWDAELYRNGQFIELRRVPTDGNLIFENVETQYGSNVYEIKLYGPYGEVETRNQYLTLDKNALSKGQMAYDIYGLDSNKRIINDQSESGYSLNNKGASLSYGVTDSWLVGVNYVSNKDEQDNNQQFLTLKNSLAFPGLLFDNEVSLQEDEGYAQYTSLTGNAFGRDTFTFIYESSDDYSSNKINSAGTEKHLSNLTYSGSFSKITYNLGGGFTRVNGENSWQFNNRLSTSLSGFNISNTLYYNRFDQENTYTDNWNGIFSLASAISSNIRFSTSLNYKPDDENDVIQKASFSLGVRDSFNIYHNLRGQYNIADDTNKWRLNYNVNLDTEHYKVFLNTTYDDNSDWSVGMGIRFFLGYDYHNNRPIFSSNFSPQSATLNTYSYLDRNPNGWRDEGDWDLEGVTFTGNSQWQELKSGEYGKAILPGVSTGVPFDYRASWEYGTQTFENRYRIYTHPGAVVDVNMPFYVTTDITGFVSKQDFNNELVPLVGALIDILNTNEELVDVVTSDIDGFYEVNGLRPGTYIIRLSQPYMEQSAYTGDYIGYKFSTPETGGAAELAELTFVQLKIDEQRKTEQIITLTDEQLNSVDTIWFDEDDINNGKIYSLPAYSNYRAQKAHFEPDALPNAPQVRIEAPIEIIERNSLPVAPITREGDQPAREIISPVESSGGLEAEYVDGINVSLLESSVVEEASEPISTNTVNDLNNETIVAVSPLNLSETIGGFTHTIQLGAYTAYDTAADFARSLTLSEQANVVSDRQSGKTIYKVTVGEFNSQNQAEIFAEKEFDDQMRYLIKAISDNSENRPVRQETEHKLQGNKEFIVQFSAAKNRENVLALASRYSYNGDLLIGEKIVGNEKWYCLVSFSFSSKPEALNWLADNDLSGWVLQDSLFSNKAIVRP